MNLKFDISSSTEPLNQAKSRANKRFVLFKINAVIQFRVKNLLTRSFILFIQLTAIVYVPSTMWVSEFNIIDFLVR